MNFQFPCDFVVACKLYGFFGQQEQDHGMGVWGAKGLVTNYGEGGGAIKWEGGHVKLPLRKGGAEKVLAMMKGGGHKKFWGSFYAVTSSLRHIVGGREKFLLFKRGVRKVFPCLEGGGTKCFGPAIFPLCCPPLPVINDQSLRISVWVAGGIYNV